MMKTMEESWGRFLPRALVLGVVLAASVFVAIRAARAQEGEAGGRTRTALTIAGTLTLPAGVTQPHLTFTFYHGARNAMNAACGPITNATVTYDVSSRTFTAEVPIDTCPGLFNGESVWVTTVVYERNGGAMLLTVERSAVNPVPYARYADQVGVSNDCPAGYERAMDPSFTGNMRLCQKIRMDGTTRVVYDEVVRVGTGASAFWVDRYEASVWSNAEGMGQSVNFGPGQPGNGQWTEDVYAFSRAGVPPRGHATWFQAVEACRASGKSLPGRVQWLLAARGTVDPGAHDGAGGRCRTLQGGIGDVPRATGMGTLCRSVWGTEDTIGNMSEWTDEWFAGAGSSVSYQMLAPMYTNQYLAPWPSEYQNDGTTNVNAFVSTPEGTAIGIPAPGLRGGNWRWAERAGIYSLDLALAPTSSDPRIGFRCVIPR